MEQQSITSDLIRGHIDTIILYSLIENDKYAQQISDSVENKSNNEYKLNQATLYSSLKRLETLKYVTSYWKDAEASGRRKYFHLTEEGKNVANSNLTNWSYSKTIIDKLMDCEPAVVTKEKVVYVVKEKEVEAPKITDNSLVNTTPSFHSVGETSNKEENSSSQALQEKNDINFRLILNSLIKFEKNKKIDQNNKINVENVSVENTSFDASDRKLNFNETITNSDYNEETTAFNGKIDFGDMKIVAAQNGYKLRVSSKDSAIPEGSLKLGLVNVITAFIILFMSLVQFIPMYVSYKSELNVSIFAVVVFFILLTVYPIFSLVRMRFEEKHVAKLYSDSIFTCAIIIFNLLLINVAIVFLANMDFSVKTNLIKFIYAPTMLMLDSILFMIFRFLLSKNKVFYTSKQ